MQDGARGHRGLPVGAFVSEGFGFEQPSSAPAASPADKPYWTTPLEKVLRARALRRKATRINDPRKPSLRCRHDTPLHIRSGCTAYTRVPVLYTKSGLAGGSCTSRLRKIHCPPNPDITRSKSLFFKNSFTAINTPWWRWFRSTCQSSPNIVPVSLILRFRSWSSRFVPS